MDESLLPPPQFDVNSHPDADLDIATPPGLVFELIRSKLFSIVPTVRWRRRSDLPLWIRHWCNGFAALDPLLEGRAHLIDDTSRIFLYRAIVDSIELKHDKKKLESKLCTQLQFGHPFPYWEINQYIASLENEDAMYPTNLLCDFLDNAVQQKAVSFRDMRKRRNLTNKLFTYYTFSAWQWIELFIYYNNYGHTSEWWQFTSQFYPFVEGCPELTIKSMGEFANSRKDRHPRSPFLNFEEDEESNDDSSSDSDGNDDSDNNGGNDEDSGNSNNGDSVPSRAYKRARNSFGSNGASSSGIIGSTGTTLNQY